MLIFCLILVNNGGTISRYPADEYPIHEFEHVIDVNLNSVFLLSQLIGKQMIKQGEGKIINIASMLLVGALVFLAAPASDYVNGHILAVDRGWLAR